jgi:hypothetical protein
MKEWLEIATTDSFVHVILGLGAFSTIVGAGLGYCVAQFRGTTSEWLGTLIALVAVVFGFLASASTVGTMRCGHHAHVPAGLAAAIGCYFPTSEAGGLITHLRWPLLALVWLGLVMGAATELSEWGGLAQLTAVDFTFFAALFAPLALAFAKRP